MSPKAAYREKAIAKIKSAISASGADAFLVNGRDNIQYLAGAYWQNALLFILPKGRSVYFIDSMNEKLAGKLLSDTGLNIITAPKSIMEAFADYCRDMKLKRIAVDGDSLSVAAFKRLSNFLPKTSFILKQGEVSPVSVLEEARKIKSPEEISLLRSAAKETVRIWRNVRKNIRTGMSEKDIARMVDMKIRASGYENSFPTISAIGANTAYPHVVPTAKRLKRDEHLLLDFGILYKGYSSDLTRVHPNGRINRQIKDFLKLVRELHDVAIRAIRPGVRISSISLKIKRIIIKNNMSDFVLHGLGHGLGINVHEKPFLREDVDECFKGGMVVTVEPGLYKENLGGVRIEDMVLVTADGCEILTK